LLFGVNSLLPYSGHPWRCNGFSFFLLLFPNQPFCDLSQIPPTYAGLDFACICGTYSWRNDPASSPELADPPPGEAIRVPLDSLDPFPGCVLYAAPDTFRPNDPFEFPPWLCLFPPTSFCRKVIQQVLGSFCQLPG